MKINNVNNKYVNELYNIIKPKPDMYTINLSRQDINDLKNLHRDYNNRSVIYRFFNSEPKDLFERLNIPNLKTGFQGIVIYDVYQKAKESRFQFILSLKRKN